jgi:hypothetical protein
MKEEKKNNKEKITILSLIHSRTDFIRHTQFFTKRW